MAVSFKSAVLPLAMAVALSFSTVGSASADALTENFDNGVPLGWTTVNNSAPTGFTSWTTGSTNVFGAYDGAADSYVSSNYNAVLGLGTISDWLILPTSTYRNGDTLSFFTRTDANSAFPDNLEVRFSTVGGVDSRPKLGATAFKKFRADTLTAVADGTPVKLPAITPKLSATPGRTQWLGPTLGQHNDEVLASLGFDAAAIARLKADGVV